MKVLQFLTALAISVFGFLAAFGWFATSDGVEAAGDAGDVDVTLIASSQSMVSMVEAWERPPSVSIQSVQASLQPVEQMDQPPTLMRPEVVDSELAKPMTRAPQVFESPKLPQIDTSVVVPPLSEPQAAPPKAPVPQPVSSPPSQKRIMTAASDQQVAQRAQGAGAAGASGQAKATEVSAQGETRNATLARQWGAQIKRQVEKNKLTPKKLSNGSGRVVLMIVVRANGRVVRASVVEPSGTRALDNAALAAVKRAGRLPSAPVGFAGKKHSFRLPISFKM